MIKLEDGKTYARANGVEETVGGTTRDHPEWVWTIQGNWFVRATGQAIAYRCTGRDKNGHDMYESVVSDHHGLVREAKNFRWLNARHQKIERT